MRYRVLGTVEPVDDRGRRYPIGSANQRTVLAVLLACRGEVVTVDALVEALWGDTPPASAVPTLRTYVSRLRANAGSALASRAGGFTLGLDPGALDAEQFEALVDRARDAEPGEAADLLGAALDLWEGPAFGDRADVDRVRAEARRLEERRSAAREAHAAALLAAGRVEEAVAATEALVTAEPLREGGWAVLIEALARAHRTAEALRAYRRAADALADAGLEPSSRLREAEQVALRGDTARDRAADVGPGLASRSDGFRPPVVASSLVGRDDDTHLILDLLEHARLVTLTGPGGVGKTRLAIEVARLAADRRELGACVVELAHLEDPTAVAELVAASLGLAADGRPAAEIVSRVGSLDLLLVLDNAEHVIDAAAATAERILTGGSAARILATSRERLAVDGEHVWSVAPLATVGPDAPAARLFRERASAVGAAPDDAVVTRVVQRLDGLPLAIEMAAARLDTTTADELADDLDEHLDTLRSFRRHVAARHRSLADVLAWSESHLDQREAHTFAELSVFAGPVPAGDIEGVLQQPGVADIVRALAARSLVGVDRSRPPARFYLLQTVRSFAARRLADAGRAEEMARRHAEWFVDVVTAADAQLRTVEEPRAHERIESIFAELRAAYGWAVHHDIDLAAALAAHLNLYARFVEEPLVWAELLLPRLPADHPHRPVLLASVAWRALRRGDITAARQFAGEALSHAGDRPTALPALDVLTDAGLFDGRVGESAAAARTMCDLAQRSGDLLYLAIGYSGISLSATYGGTPSADSDAVRADLDDLPLPPSGRGWLAYTRGERCQRDDPHRALTHFAAALAAARDAKNSYLEGAAIVSSCSLRARTGDPGEALDAFAEAVRHWVRLANTTQQLTTLRNLAVLFQRADEPDALTELLGTVDRSAVPTYGEEADRLHDARAWAKRTLGPARFAELNAVGAARDVTTAATAALQAIDTLSRSRAAHVSPHRSDGDSEP